MLKYKYVSIIISVFKKNSYLSQSIKSILNQTYNFYELIIINDNPKNLEIKNILEEFKKKDKRIRVINNKKNIGLAASLNKGIRLSKYDLIFRMDSDDISHNKRLEKQVNYMNNHKHVDVLGANAILIKKDGTSFGKTNLPHDNEEIKKKIIFQNPLIHPSICYKKKIFKKGNFYNENFKKCQDIELWMRLRKKKIIFSNLKACLIRYRVSEEIDLLTIFYDFKASFKYFLNSKNFYVPFIRFFRNIIFMFIRFVKLT